MPSTAQVRSAPLGGLASVYGRIWLAGEHVATWTGYLEGAVESGERVADEIHGAS